MPSLTNQPAAIDIAHVDVRRGDLHILQDISAAAPQGSSTVLVGPNGAGKSTLLHCIINEIAYTGEIRMQGKSGRRPRLAYVPQNLQMDSVPSGSASRAALPGAPVRLWRPCMRNTSSAVA